MAINNILEVALADFNDYCLGSKPRKAIHKNKGLLHPLPIGFGRMLRLIFRIMVVLLAYWPLFG